MRNNEVVLILQIGSLGDTVISLPCYREIERRHPRADRYLLTNFPIGSKGTAPSAILAPTGVIKDCIEYPMPLRRFGQVAVLYRQITRLKPDVLYYLLPEERTSRLIRHYAFFKACGIPRIVGMPWSAGLRFSRELVPGRLWESEARRLLRTIGVTQETPADADRNLALTGAERAAADEMLRQLGGSSSFVAVSVGGKVPINDWGDGNWAAALQMLSASRPDLGAVFVGSADERERNDRLACHWQGFSLNVCGRLAPRETAAMIERADAFLGHDTGALHLAAAVGTPIVAVFSARNKAGVWYSDRPCDVFFYNRVACAGCRLLRVEDCLHELICMAGHDPAAVAAAVLNLLPAVRSGGVLRRASGAAPP